jgi:uncharacterized membrane protein YjjP (DUF1212 family)
MNIIDAVNRITRQVANGELDRFQVRKAFEKLDHLPPQYPASVVVVMVGLACAAFSRLFGGDWAVFGVTFAASAAAMWVRQQLSRSYFNALLVVIVTAFVAGFIASSATLLKLSPQPQTALAASVLLLVPGVPLINSAQDLIKGHLVIGIVRGVTGGLISLGIAAGLTLAMRLLGVNGL